jgi:UDP-N-acetyl-D-glucosamine dehydrogenase
VSNTPKVVGGVTAACAEVATSLYQSVVDQVVPVSSPKAAEMVKLLENTFRATNIAMVNEIALMCERLEIDVWEVIEAAETKPFGFMPFQPGPGLGGHCLPVDPEYLAWKLRTLDYTARFIQLAAEINTGMPAYWVGKVQDALNAAGKPVKNSRIVVLGVTYKRDVPDTRESPALDIISLLLEKGADVSYHDPLCPELSTELFKMDSLTDPELQAGLENADCVLIVTDHTSYDWQRVRDSAALIVDTRNAVGRLSRRRAEANP